MIPLLVGWLGCASPSPAPPPAEPPAPALPADDAGPALPDGSVYDYAAPLEDQDGRPVGLDVYRGGPAVLTMFYGTCKAACPMLVGKLKSVEAALSPEAREGLRVLMVSFDPERDTPAQLRATAAEQGLDLARWRLARPRPEDVRPISALLGVKFNRLTNGDFNHSSVLVLVDGDGRPVARLGTLSDDPAPLVAAAEALLQPR